MEALSMKPSFYSIDCIAHNFFYDFFCKNKHIVNTIEEADYILLPYNYEILYDYHEIELERIGVSDSILLQLQKMAIQLNQLSITSRKRLVVFYYRDSETALPFDNAIVFRTSWRKSNAEKFVYDLPAFIEHIVGNDAFTIRNKTTKPSVSFYGHSAPLRLTLVASAKNFIRENFKFTQKFSLFKIWINEGYLIRRAAIKSVLKFGSKINADIKIRSNVMDAVNSEFKNEYLKSLAANDYFICAAGLGNYSYRLYEVMREGRIPVFIDTNCLLPMHENREWKNLIIWIEKKYVHKTAEIIFNFHSNISPSEFVERQQKIKAFYNDNFTLMNFAKYVLTFLSE